MTDSVELLAVGAGCPPDLLQELTETQDVYESIDIVRPLVYCNSCYINVVRAKRSGRTAVVKSYFKWKLSEPAKQQVDLEIALHQRLIHPHTVKFWFAFDDSSQRHIVMEYCSKGNLRNFQDAMSERHLRKHLVKPLLAALAHLHNEGIVHRDVKPENIFITDDGTVKLGDYGLAVMDPSASRSSQCSSDQPSETKSVPCSRDADSSPAQLLQAGGTPAYTAPEVVKAAMHNTELSSVISTKNDVWAVGVIAFEMLTGKHPYASPNASSGEVMCAVASGDCIPLPRSGISGPLRSFLSTCLEEDPAKRASAEQLLNHPWILAENSEADTAKAAAAAAAATAAAAAAASGEGGTLSGPSFAHLKIKTSTPAAASSAPGSSCSSPTYLWSSAPKRAASASPHPSRLLFPGLGALEACPLGSSPPLNHTSHLLDSLPFGKRSNSSMCGFSSLGKDPRTFLETIDSWEY